MNLRQRIKYLGSRLLLDPDRIERRLARASARRQQAGVVPRLLFFHGVADPYSHLLLQRLPALLARWPLALEMHLVPAPEPAFAGDGERLPVWARRDAADVAAAWGCSFVDPGRAPAAMLVQAVQQRLVPQLAEPGCLELAAALGQALWQGGPVAGDSSSDAGPAEVTAALARGRQRQRRLGHWAGGMLWFEGAWYWGLDRLEHLERRLQRLAAAGGLGPDAVPDAPLVAPRPAPTEPPGGWRPGAAAHLTLQYFPSLRSPYTAIAHHRLMDLVARTGVQLQVRPVMPMMMRGVPAPRAKQIHIMLDTLREAQRAGQAFGPMVDPFGAPVQQAFALWPWLHEHGAGAAFVGHFLDQAFHAYPDSGIDITSRRGLAQVVAACGLDPAAASRHADAKTAAAMLADNMAAMHAFGLWGVPSFHLSGGGQPDWSAWGQDRLWRLESEIAARV